MNLTIDFGAFTYSGAGARMLREVNGPRGRRSRGPQRLGLFAAGLAATLSLASPNAFAEPATAKIAVALSLTGPNASIGRPDLEGARLAVEEANAAGGAPTIELLVYDDASNAADGARRAHEISGGDALLVLGPGTTAMALNEGPIYSDAGMVAIGPTTTGDRVTDPENFFRAIFSTGDAGEILAAYIRYNLAVPRAIVLMKDDSYGHAVADGFKRAADWLGVAAEFRSYKNAEEAEVAAGLAAAALPTPRSSSPHMTSTPWRS
jgi:branched-chain amino acid transport system substrate-binding protein